LIQKRRALDSWDARWLTSLTNFEDNSNLSVQASWLRRNSAFVKLADDFSKTLARRLTWRFSKKGRDFLEKHLESFGTVLFLTSLQARVTCATGWLSPEHFSAPVLVIPVPLTAERPELENLLRLNVRRAGLTVIVLPRFPKHFGEVSDFGNLLTSIWSLHSYINFPKVRYRQRKRLYFDVIQLVASSEASIPKIPFLVKTHPRVLKSLFDLPEVQTPQDEFCVESSVDVEATTC
jgi:hypothetical protein